MTRILLLFTAMIYCVSCSNSKGITQHNVADQAPQQAGIIAGPPTFIYKTRNNYNDKVPVLLSEDKQELISYPDPRDLKTGDEFTYPTLLAEGYLLDNRGINRNVAFLKLTYEEYAALPTKPDQTKLMEMILDKDPLTELYFCGSRRQYGETTIVDQLNTMIRKQQIAQKFEKIK